MVPERLYVSLRNVNENEAKSDCCLKKMSDKSQLSIFGCHAVVLHIPNKMYIPIG